MLTSKKTKAIAMLLSLIMMLSVFSVFGTVSASAYANVTITTQAKPSTFYFKPNETWLQGNVKFVMYLRGYGAGSKTVMTDLGNGFYSADAPADYTNRHVQFIRVDANDTSVNLNSSDIIEIPEFGGDCFISKIGVQQNFSGTWTTYADTPASDTVYFKPNKNWLKSGARFAIYLTGDKHKPTWVSMTDLGNGYYSATLPQDEYLNLTFIRMNPNSEENTWSAYWNKSQTYSIYSMPSIRSNGTDCFTMNENEWSSATGTWSNNFSDKTVYLRPNANWKLSNARFAVYLFGGKSEPTWISMTANSFDNNYYSAEVPAGDYKYITFTRMNPNSEENSWTNLWNKTERLSFPLDGNNCFTVDENTWSSASGEWSESGFKTIYLKPDDMWLENCESTIIKDYDSDKEITMVNTGNGYYKAEVLIDEFEKFEFIGVTDNLVDDPYGEGYVDFICTPVLLSDDNSSCFVLKYYVPNFADGGEYFGAWDLFTEN